MTANLVGAWSPYISDFSKEAENAFEEAMKNYDGANYKPVAVAVQLISGNNYTFFCNTRLETPEPRNSTALVGIHKPLEGLAKVTSIQPLS